MKNIKNYKNLIWFLAGFIIFIFTRTNTYIPLAIIIGPIFIIRFMRNIKVKPAILLAWIGFFIAIEIPLRGYPDLGNVFFLISDIIKNFMIATVLAIPYFIDRIIAGKIKGFARTLVFPVSAVAIYFLNSEFGPFEGSAIFYSFTQYGNMVLIQGLSIGGLWGMVFFISWIPSFTNWIWENSFEWQNIRKGFFLVISVYLMLFLYGGLKKSPMFFDYTSKTVRVASITFPPGNEDEYIPVIEKIDNRFFSDFEIEIARINNLSRQVAENNSKIAAFQEFSLIIPEKREKELIDNLKEIAIGNNIYICFCYTTIPERKDIDHEYTFGMIELDDEEEGKTKAVLIDNNGNLEIDYMKHHLVKGEDNWILNGPGGISVVESPFGRIGVVICKDMEFPSYMREAANKRADIIIAPSYEATKSLSITYSQMLRAVEYGFSFVRPCGYGLSIAIDYHGRVIASQNYFTTPTGIMYADIPTKGITTIYSVIGDLIAWTFVAIFLFTIGWVVIKKIKNRN